MDAMTKPWTRWQSKQEDMYARWMNLIQKDKFKSWGCMIARSKIMDEDDWVMHDGWEFLWERWPMDHVQWLSEEDWFFWSVWLNEGKAGNWEWSVCDL